MDTMELIMVCEIILISVVLYAKNSTVIFTAMTIFQCCVLKTEFIYLFIPVQLDINILTCINILSASPNFPFSFKRIPCKSTKSTKYLIVDKIDQQDNLRNQGSQLTMYR